MARSGDFSAHRAELRHHVLRMASVDRELAVWSAWSYEFGVDDDPAGPLAGFYQEIRAALGLPPVSTTAPPTNTTTTTGRRNRHVPA
ncbi:hypothetical protein [Ramlibacter sp.]|uniref:hypothetical protein n=1 Tax=Ramlibacter sp. TaxID=1917967 RepID=UPI003D0E141E